MCTSIIGPDAVAGGALDRAERREASADVEICRGSIRGESRSRQLNSSRHRNGVSPSKRPPKKKVGKSFKKGEKGSAPL